MPCTLFEYSYISCPNILSATKRGLFELLDSNHIAERLKVLSIEGFGEAIGLFIILIDMSDCYITTKDCILNKVIFQVHVLARVRVSELFAQEFDSVLSHTLLPDWSLISGRYGLIHLNFHVASQNATYSDSGMDREL